MKRKPVYVAKNGNVTVPVYFSQSCKKGVHYSSYRVVYTKAGKRVDRSFCDRDRASDHADAAAQALSLGTISSAPPLSSGQQAEYWKLKELESNLEEGMTLWDFCTKSAVPAYLHLRENGFVSLVDAATYYCRGFKGKKRRTVAEAIADFLAQKKQVLAKSSYNGLRKKLNKLRDAYGSKDVRDLELSDVALLIMVMTGQVPAPPGFPIRGPTAAKAKRSRVLVVPRIRADVVSPANILSASASANP